VLPNTLSFVVDVPGQLTKRRYEGVFELKTRLSTREKLREDELRRSILGGSPQHADPDMADTARALAYLTVRVIKGPAWWAELNGLLDCEDDNVLVAVNNAAVEAFQEATEKMNKKAEDAKRALRAEAPKETPFIPGAPDEESPEEP
jgi:hypothetical protein